MSEYIVDTFGIVQDFADLHGDMSTPLYQAIMDVMLSRQHEEIVRCRDCKFRCLNECTRIDEGFKDYWFAIEPNGYCAWGDPKEGSE